MNRAQLECLDRDTLIARAEEAGVTRARILTRPELVDELLLRDAADEATKQRARGFFGRARDLLARVVERGLHLPDAAERIRSLGIPLPRKRAAPIALPTVTLAEIYVTQGHRDRAMETLEAVLAREPDHSVARTLLDRLRNVSDSMLPRPMPSERDSVAPPEHDLDECVAIPVEPRTLYAYWAVRTATVERVHAEHPRGAIALRLFVVVPTWDGPEAGVQDREVSACGDVFVDDLPPKSVVRAAIGWKEGDAFLPFAHSAAFDQPAGAASSELAGGLVRWTPDGTVPLAPGDRDAAALDRALRRLRGSSTNAAPHRRVFPNRSTRIPSPTSTGSSNAP